MSKKYRFRMSATQPAGEDREAVMVVDSEIIAAGDADWLPGVSTRTLRDTLQNFLSSGARSLTLQINCDGGDVQEALAMFDALVELPIPTRCLVRGNCASAATLLALACDEVEMSPNSFFMVHEPAGRIAGDLTHLTQQVEHFAAMREKVCAIYASKTGMTAEEVSDYLRAGEHWLTAEEAVAQKFADRITGQAADPQTDTEVSTDPDASPETTATADDPEPEKPGMLARIGRMLARTPEPEAPAAPTAEEQLSHLRAENEALTAAAAAARADLTAALADREDAIAREVSRRSAAMATTALADLPTPCASLGEESHASMSATDYILARAGATARA